ncbi:MAG: response regulator, partial [Eubacteriales bacterium]|nr:response regulator [Eubacteriales bacterium]
QEKMFEPFTQESNEVTSQLQGTGLGLAIVKNLVELMNGNIQVKSEPGKGTEFTVHLDMPVAQGAKKNVERHPRTAQEALLGKHILLVEDHPLNMQIAKALLEKKGMRVTSAQNGKEAVDLFAGSKIHEFDAVLMDIRMPVMDGVEAARQIRALPRSDAAQTPIVAMSANAFEADVQNSLRAGMNAHLAKPIDPNRLCAELAKWMKPIKK